MMDDEPCITPSPEEVEDPLEEESKRDRQRRNRAEKQREEADRLAEEQARAAERQSMMAADPALVRVVVELRKDGSVNISVPEEAPGSLAATADKTGMPLDRVAMALRAAATNLEMQQTAMMAVNMQLDAVTNMQKQQQDGAIARQVLQG